MRREAHGARQMARHHVERAREAGSIGERAAHARAAKAYQRLALAHVRQEGRIVLFDRRARAWAALATFPTW